MELYENKGIKMLEFTEKLNIDETLIRQSKLKQLFQANNPHVSGILVFSSLNIYYLTGTFALGTLWIPINGEPILFVRKGLERAKAETSLKYIFPLKSYSELKALCAEHGSALGPSVGAEMTGLTWSMSQMLQARIKDVEFIDASQYIMKTRSIKSEYEQNKMSIAGERHLESYKALVQKIKPMMTEREIATLAFNEFLEREHSGILRATNLGSEIFLGQIACGNNANYPTYWDGPVGYLGGHPASPYMGNSKTKWEKNSLLILDVGFSYQGYHTDKTQVFWSGPESSMPDYLKKAHDVCVEIQNNAANSLIAGAIPEVIWQKALETADKAGFLENFMGVGGNQVKFLGHGIGLTFDEFPPIANKFREPLEVGMTIALEPKMGFAGVGMVGTENVYKITENGAVSITGTDFDIVYID